jgi:hypothetical protein
MAMVIKKKHVMTEIQLLLHNTFSEYLIDNLTNSFHINLDGCLLGCSAV